MDLPTLALATFQAVMSFLLINSRSLLPEYMLAERFARNGIFKGRGFPDAEVPAPYVARLRARERTAALVSALTLVPALAASGLLPDPMQAFPLLVSVAFVGRAVTLAVLGAREALRAAAGPRVSRGRVVLLTDLVPAWVIALVVAVQVAFVVAATVFVDGPAWQPWGLGGGLGLTVATLGLAAWLARQPQAAEGPEALAWSDSERREYVVQLLSIGPLVTMMLGALLLRVAEGPVGVLVWANFGVVMIALLIADVASRRHASQRLATRETIDARR